MSVITLVACLLASGVTAQLSGTVVDAKGKAVSRAIVVVSTARPKQGPATTCPSCYRDCSKRTLTDAQGRFKIEGLAGTLQFTLAAGAAGYQGVHSDFYDPAERPEIELILNEISNSDAAIPVIGHVTDNKGEPVDGAEVRVRTIHRTNGRIGGSDKSVTSLTLTGKNGRFEISAGNHIKSFDVRVVASGFAPTEVHWSRSDNQPLSVELGRGASLRGKLVFEGKPVPSVEIGLVQKNRIIGNIVTPQEVHTDSTGTFLFEQLPPELDYSIYTHIGQDAPAVLPVSLLTAPQHGELADFGDIGLSEPTQLTVQVRTDDGTPLTKDSYVVITRRDAWRGARVILENQPFAVARYNDVPREKFGIILRVPGYKVLKTNPPTNIDLNRRYEVSVVGDTKIEFVMTPVKAIDRPKTPKQSI